MTYDPNVPPNPPPMPPRGNGANRALYFIVGGLVVLAAVFVFIFTNGDAGDGALDAGVTETPPAATEPATPAPEPAPAPAPAPEGGTTNQ
jgi:hypothetical protein